MKQITKTPQPHTQNKPGKKNQKTNHNTAGGGRTICFPAMLRDGNSSIKELRDTLKVTHPDMLRICWDLTEKGCFLHTICSANACNNTEGSRGWKSTLAAEFPCFLQNTSGQQTKTVPGDFKTPQSPPQEGSIGRGKDGSTRRERTSAGRAGVLPPNPPAPAPGSSQRSWSSKT